MSGSRIQRFLLRGCVGGTGRAAFAPHTRVQGVHAHFPASRSSWGAHVRYNHQHASGVGTLIQQKVPDFTAQAVLPDESMETLSLSQHLKGKYGCILFYPLNFTFVCPTEILAFSKAVPEFKTRGVELIGVSVDSHFSHLAWRQLPVEKGGIGKINFPLVSDLTKSISRDFGVLLDNSVSLRGLFIIDKKGIVRHSLVNDLPLGRSVGEALRVLDALQHHETHGEVCPANWTKGQEAMKASSEGVAAYLSKHN